MQLTLGLQRAGRLNPAAPVPGRSPIPRNVAYLMPDKLARDLVETRIKAILRCNPSLRFQGFDENLAQAFLAEACPGFVSAAFRRASDWPKRADLFRLGFLSTRGGYVVDPQARCFSSFENAGATGIDFVADQDLVGGLGRAFIGAGPGHPLIERALHEACRSVLHNEGDFPWLSTGPGLMARIFASMYAEIASSSADWLSRLHVLPRAVSRGIASHD